MNFPEEEFGLPIEGERQHGRTHLDQKPIEELRPLIEAVLALNSIHDFGWEQYTPYFNDGDVCEFGISDVWFRTTKDVNQPQDIPPALETLRKSGHITQEEYKEIASRPPRVSDDEEFSEWNYHLYSHPNISKGSYLHSVCQALGSAIGSGSFNDALEDTFGDHVKVRITKEKIIVKEYQHD